MRVRSGGLRVQDCQISDNWPSFLSLTISEKRCIIASETEKMEKQSQGIWRGKYNNLRDADRTPTPIEQPEMNAIPYKTMQCQKIPWYIIHCNSGPCNFSYSVSALFFLKFSLLDMLEHLKTRDQPARKGCGQYLNLSNQLESTNPGLNSTKTQVCQNKH